jgi:hypothetical protein
MLSSLGRRQPSETGPPTHDEDARMRNHLRGLLGLVAGAREAAIDRQHVRRGEMLLEIEERLGQVASQIEALPKLTEDNPADPEQG